MGKMTATSPTADDGDMDNDKSGEGSAYEDRFVLIQ